jgi:2-oxoglutarate dehydrogenase E2 component (dihydrolipoamide succinyltransferase)
VISGIGFMPTDVVMPQMGESIAEGTIVRWIKKEGDQVARDEPLFEISTDKVDAEIPSPAAGIIDQIRVQEGETVPVNSVVAIIRQANEQQPRDEKQPKKVADNTAAAPSVPAPAPATAPTPAPVASAAAVPAAASPPVAPPPEAQTAQGIENRIRQRSSPLVRKIAKDRNIDISKIHGTGIAGRVTKRDIIDFIAGSGPAASATVEARPVPSAPSPSPSSGLPGQTQPMSVMRKRIAEHMVLSRRTSAHVHSVFEVNFHRVAQTREAKKAEYEKAGVKLTYLSFILKAVVEGLKAVPVVNASIDGDNIVYHEDVNIGIAVALDWGLIVPVIKKADGSNLLGLSRSVADLAARARSKQLKPDEVAGGTFTVTNPGVFGALFGMPIINQPQVAILGVGNIEKRPIVIDDAIAIRPMAYLTLGYDHRLIDGAVADQFMSHVKQTLENWDPTQA